MSLACRSRTRAWPAVLVVVAPVLVLLALAGSAAAADLSHYETTDSGFVAVAGEDTVLFTYYGTDIVRVDFLPAGGGRPQPSPMVVREAVAGIELGLSADENEVHFSTPDLTVRLNRRPFSIEFWGPEGHLLSEPSEGGLSAGGATRTAAFMLKPGLHLYGTGERGVGIDMRGYRLETYNRQVYGYGGPPWNMMINVPFLATSQGYALFFDVIAPGTFDLGLTDSGLLSFEEDGEELAYFFMAAPDVPAQLERFTWLTGRQPMPPKWALGYLQSKFGYYDRAEAEYTVDTLREKNIPADAIMLDLYWFSDMGDFSWQRSAWPDPEGMTADFAERGLKTITITEPYFTQYSTHYGSLVGGLKDYVGHTASGDPYLLSNWWTCGCDAVLLDMTNPVAREWLWGLYAEILGTGVAGFWTDLGEPERHPDDMFHQAGPARLVHNIYNFRWAEAIFEGFRRDRPGERLFNLTRSGCAGIQRFGVFTWSGDVARTFGGLAAQMPIILNTGLSGLGYHSSDLGGFGGYSTPELYVRWLEHGALSPVMRPHGAGNEGTEPWAHGKAAEAIAVKYIRLRYRLLPYIYTLAWENHSTGMPLMRPLFFHDPEDDNLSGLSDAYMFGPDLLVAPVTEEGATARQVCLPRGLWVDFWSDSVFAGGRVVTVDAPLEKLPLFVRTGAIIPTGPVADYAGAIPQDTLTLDVYPSRPDEREVFTLYEDDGESLEYEEGAYATTEISQELGCWAGQRALRVEIARADGSFRGMPGERSILLKVHHIASPPDTVRLNSADLAQAATEAELLESREGYFFQPAARLLLVKLDYTPVSGSSVEITGFDLADGLLYTCAPPALGLLQNRPNPFLAETEIPFRLSIESRVIIEVFDLQGRKICTVFDEVRGPGPHAALWDGYNDQGEPCRSGVYFCRFRTAGLNQSRKMILLR
jgi:alpha-glucosidase (family GH31 glycosyl hydrolase)